MSVTLIAMRHAHAVASHEQSDELRPLSDAGRDLAVATGKLLKKLDWVPELIIASSAVRTTETANLVATELPAKPLVVTTRELYNATAEMYLPVLVREVGEESTVMVVGHNPGVGVLMRTLAGKQLAVSPGTTCVFSIDCSWHKLRGLSHVPAILSALIIDGELV